MSLDARFEMFGNPSELRVQEAVWCYCRSHPDAPLWEEVAEGIMELSRIGTDPFDCDAEEADRRICEAIREGEVRAVIRGGDALMLGLELDRATYDRLTRRYLDLTMPRRDREEMF